MVNTAWITPAPTYRSRLQSRNQPVNHNGLAAAPSRLSSLVENFAPINLKEMDSVALLDRIDTKFVLTAEELFRTLAALQQDYRMLSVGGQRLNHYRSLYFDTPDFDLYKLHVNGRANRYKVRSREYVDSGLSFLEVKHRTPKGRTIKDRLSTSQLMAQMSHETETWLHGYFPYDSRELEPKIWNTFTRITLVSKENCERVTLDLNLTFYTENKVATLDGLAIAEVKMCSENRASSFLAQMRAQKVHPSGFSKYCMGISLLYDQVKKNSMKPKMLWIKKKTGGVIYYE